MPFLTSSFHPRLILAACLSMLACTSAWADADATKREIIALATTYQGQGDPDGAKQRSLEALVERLLTQQPQPPLKDRLPLLYGAWKQVWGPYIYTDDSRGVDADIDPGNIIQVVLEGGYYYNVNPTLARTGKPPVTTLLRGEYTLDPSRPNILNVQFTKLNKLDGLGPDGLRLQDLPAKSEARQLPGERSALPAFLVRLLFGKGSLREVYTDADLRITYGSSRDNLLKNYIYILQRVPG